MKYRNRVAFYISVALITFGVLFLPISNMFTRAWAAGGGVYLVSSIGYFIFYEILLTKILPFKKSREKSDGSAFLIALVFGIMAIIFGLYKTDLFIVSAGVALVYFGLEYKIVKSQTTLDKVVA